MATFYGDLNEAASMAGSGVTVSDLTPAQQRQVNSWIESKTYNGDAFDIKTVVDEFYNIGSPLPGSSLVKSLLLRHRPIISITSLTDDARSTTPTLVNSEAYVLDYSGETGILRLESKAVTGTNIITGFTRGIHTVKISYKWGFQTRPEKVAELATLMLAKWGEINNQQSNSDGLKSLEAADYKEVYDLTFLNVRTKYDAEIKMLWQELRDKYYNFV